MKSEYICSLRFKSFSIFLQLGHYLDEVEVHIAKQVSSKSDAFFHTMTSHDALMENLGQTLVKVGALR